MVGLGSCQVLMEEEGWMEILVWIGEQHSGMVGDIEDLEVGKSCLIIRLHETAELRTWDRQI